MCTPESEGERERAKERKEKQERRGGYNEYKLQYKRIYTIGPAIYVFQLAFTTTEKNRKNVLSGWGNVKNMGYCDI